MKIILTGGGTGGHIYPALAIADKLKEINPDTEFLYLGSREGVDKDIVPKYGYKLKPIPAGFIEPSKTIFGKGYQYLKAAVDIRRGTLKTKKIIKEFAPDMIIGTGGFVTLPVLMAAKELGIPYIIHEQNAFPGRVNKMLSKDAKRVFLGFENARENFDYKDNLKYVGNPVRKVFYNINKINARMKLGIPIDKRVVFTFGGSQGSEVINKVAAEYLKNIEEEKDSLLISGGGTFNYDSLLTYLKEKNIKFNNENARIYKYIDNIENYLAAADLVVTRAGALSIAEIMAVHVPAVIIPMKYSKDNHQYYNGKFLRDKGGAVMIEEDDLDYEYIGKYLLRLSRDNKELEKMKKATGELDLDSSKIIVEDIIKIIKN